jgi:hypothetical protein
MPGLWLVSNVEPPQLSDGSGSKHNGWKLAGILGLDPQLLEYPDRRGEQ